MPFIDACGRMDRPTVLLPEAPPVAPGAFLYGIAAVLAGLDGTFEVEALVRRFEKLLGALSVDVPDGRFGCGVPRADSRLLDESRAGKLKGTACPA